MAICPPISPNNYPSSTIVSVRNPRLFPQIRISSSIVLVIYRALPLIKWNAEGPVNIISDSCLFVSLHRAIERAWLLINYRHVNLLTGAFCSAEGNIFVPRWLLCSWFRALNYAFPWQTLNSSLKNRSIGKRSSRTFCTCRMKRLLSLFHLSLCTLKVKDTYLDMDLVVFESFVARVFDHFRGMELFCISSRIFVVIFLLSTFEDKDTSGS